MSLLTTIAKGTTLLQFGSSALSLVGATAALVRQNQGVKGINNFLFHVPLGEELTMTAQITDHYVEGNFAVQDHIALEPIRLRLTGMISELVYTKDQLEGYLDTVLDRLSPVNALNPELAASTKQYLAQYNRTKQAVESAWDTIRKTKGDIVGEPALTRQQESFAQLANWFNGRSAIMGKDQKSFDLLTVETPWATFPNMAIENITFSQDETTKEWSTIEVVMKQIRFVKANVFAGQLTGRAKAGEGVKEKGVAQPTPGQSVLDKAIFGKS